MPFMKKDPQVLHRGSFLYTALRLLSERGERVRALVLNGDPAKKYIPDGTANIIDQCVKHRVRILAMVCRFTGKEPLLSEFNIHMLNRNNDFDCSKAERELGFRCRPFSESIRDTVIWLQKEGFIDLTEKIRALNTGYKSNTVALSVD